MKMNAFREFTFSLCCCLFPIVNSCGYATSYRIGETFIHLPQAKAMKRLEKDLSVVTDEISAHESDADDCDKQMKELKLVLYAKFGSAINLDE